MYNYAAAIAGFLQRLQLNPHINFTANEFNIQHFDTDQEGLEGFAEFLAKKYGEPFPLPAEDRQLVGLPRQFDIAWESTPGLPLAAGRIDFVCGCLNLRALSTAFAEPSYDDLDDYPASLLDEMPLLRIGTIFDGGSRANTTTYLTYLLYDPATRQYQGLAVKYGLRILPLPLSIGEYVRAALAWHGGWGWHFLYLAPDDFYSLDGSTLLTLYDLRDGLPELFPDADWSIIDTKREYFEYARQFVRS